ncbi:hypothetical protein BH20ACT16_BH20ACT16_13430 [soil metagenome]
MGVVVLSRTGCTWEDFREHFVAAIAARPQQHDESAATAYYAAWLEALEALVADRGLLSSSAGR